MISRKEYKKAKKIVKEYKNQSSIVQDLECEHDWHCLDSHSDDMICIKCDKNDWY